MLIKNKDDFWNAIIGDSTKDVEKMYKVLSARGFLLELNDDIIKVLDNNHVDDFDYLDMILKELRIGRVSITMCDSNNVKVNDKYGGYPYDATHIVKTGVIEIEKEVDIGKFTDKMLITDRIGIECCGGTNKEWWWFLDRINGEKVPVRILETYIARYIKGLSACGLATCRSCDGNHKVLEDKVYLDFDTKPNDLFYDAICKSVLNKKFDFNYRFAMPLNEENQYSLYYNLNIAGEFLFNNRDYFRKIKTNFYIRYNSKFLNKDANKEKLEADFIEYLKTSFDSFEKECVK